MKLSNLGTEKEEEEPVIEKGKLFQLSQHQLCIYIRFDILDAGLLIMHRVLFI